MTHPFLSRFEVLLFRWLSRSPRVGLVLIKQKDGPLSWVIRDTSDTVPMPKVEEPEPPSMLFERMYHAPDAEPRHHS